MGDGQSSYRRDIDGLRAIAVLAVIVFHFGYLPNGYLGVDVFFVISGFLITGIIYKEILENRFSMRRFYLRRTRRIIPLVSVVNLVALVVGIWIMLPDDLENLSQSVVATNFFGNNVLQYVTTKNYWDVINEYKPLMHTWSLGIEEQFYLFYPLLFLLLGKKHARRLPIILLGLTLLSIGLFFSSYHHAAKFYLLPFRFFELTIGGLGAILYARKPWKHPFGFLLVALLFTLLLVDFSFFPPEIELCLTVTVTLGVLISVNNESKIVAFFLQNPMMVGIGKISFSLYMWHQLVLAFDRYFFSRDYSWLHSAAVLILIFLLSVVSYYWVEQPFRNKQRIKTPVLLWSLGALFILTTSASLYLNHRGGILYDIPELDISASNIQKDLHPRYNHRIYRMDRPFENPEKINVMIIGDSFGRDWANVLLESQFSNEIEISYTDRTNPEKDLEPRLKTADYIFFTETGNVAIESLIDRYLIERKKIRYVGTKNFGTSNGIFFSKRGEPGYCNQRTVMEDGVLKKNAYYKKYWGEQYIDLIDMVMDENQTVPVFTPQCKFISQDCRHLTQSGARYFGQMLQKSGWKPVRYP